MNDVASLKIPQHVAIIMDGNGRWAQRRGLPRIEGHKAGAESVRRVVEACSEFGIRYLTLYAFSTENWRRPAGEVKELMRLLTQFLTDRLVDLRKHRVRLNAIGQIQRLPLLVRRRLKQVMEETKDFDGGVLTLALSYGSRDEIVTAVRSLAADAVAGRITIDEIDEEIFEERLFTAGMPAPDLVIRTSNEKRLSNFLLWQASYAELFFSEVLWPDFDRAHLLEAIRDYTRRDRRFGDVSHA